MSTGSTKSRDRKVAKKVPTTPIADQPNSNGPVDLSPRVWWIASLAILAVAAAVRLYALELKPMHHDEGVNGYFLKNLYQEGVYRYNPENYHGPTLYFFALALTKLKAFLFGEPGMTTVVVRLVPVFFGVATVGLALLLRRHIGSIGALAAGALIAFSPGGVYISRYFIHEAQFVFFTLGIVVAALRYRETADSVYLMLAAISAALLCATKETAVISLAVLGLAWGVAVGYMTVSQRVMGRRSAKDRSSHTKSNVKRAGEKGLARTFESLGGFREVATMAALALTLFVFVNILFYSSFFTYWKGVEGAIESIRIWAKTGTKEHGHDWHTYLRWLVQQEAPLLFLGLTGAVIALVRRLNRFAIFAGAWAFGILAAYSLIPYKTPWLMLNFTVPLAVIGGYAVNEIYFRGKSVVSRVAALSVLAAALSICGTQAIILNFYRYDNDRYPYVYAHTYREFLPMVNEIDRLAARAGTGKQTAVTVTAPEYWPLPWYLREYPRAGFFGRMTPTEEPIVVGSSAQQQELDSALGDRYLRINSYPLRPGVTLLLYARRDLAEP